MPDPGCEVRPRRAHWTCPRRCFCVRDQRRILVQTAWGRGGSPGRWPTPASQRTRSVPLEMLDCGLVCRLGRLVVARRRALARPAVDRAGGPFRRTRLPGGARRALLWLPPRPPAMGRAHNHRSRAGGGRTHQRQVRPREIVLGRSYRCRVRGVGSRWPTRSRLGQARQHAPQRGHDACGRRGRTDASADPDKEETADRESRSHDASQPVSGSTPAPEHPSRDRTATGRRYRDSA